MGIPTNRPRLASLERAIAIASNELSGAVRIVPGQEIILSTCLMRVLDGAVTSCALLSAGYFSFVPVIIRAQIEAIAQYRAMFLDEKSSDRIIYVNNKRRIKNMEAAIRSGVLTREHRDIAALMSKKAKIENSANDVEHEMNISELIDGLDDDILKCMYSWCSLHGHNDLNEMVALYVERKNNTSIVSMPGKDRVHEVQLYAAHEMILLFKIVVLYHECNGLVPSETVFELGGLATGKGEC